jgi:CheY-like chemotaxis protein/nitrogen-specific signal transduction histidine kinase
MEEQLYITTDRLELVSQELLRVTQIKEEFLATMSHELRTPLNAILGCTEALQEEVLGPLNERQLKSLSTIKRSGQRLLSLINDILDVSKIEAGEVALDINTIAVLPLCDSSLASIQQQAADKEIQLDLQVSSAIVNIAVDEQRMRQVLINLLSNAVKFTAARGQITLSVNQAAGVEENGAIDFAVTDTGIGIASADQDKLFQPFVQLDSKLNRQYAGAGLGLAFVKQIVELHGGRVLLQSELGQGSCFTVRLPQTCLMPDPGSSNIMPVTSDYSQPETTTSALILLVENDEAYVNTFSNYLTAKGYRTVWAKNGQEAIELADSKLPDLILMNLQMPQMDVLAAITSIRQNPQLVTIPIIALTTLTPADDFPAGTEIELEHCLAIGASDYLTKPVQLKQLNLKIRKFLNLS